MRKKTRVIDGRVDIAHAHSKSCRKVLLSVQPLLLQGPELRVLSDVELTAGGCGAFCAELCVVFRLVVCSSSCCSCRSRRRRCKRS